MLKDIEELLKKRREDEERRQRETEIFDDLFSSKDYSENGDSDNLFGNDNDEEEMVLTDRVYINCSAMWKSAKIALT